jgi:hypothetical protein
MANTYFSAAGVDDALAGIVGVSGGTTNGWISLHSSSPGTTGANEINGAPYAREQTTWGTPASSASAGSQVTFSIPATTTIAYFGIWTAQSGGTYVGGGPLPSSETYTGSGGSYLLTPTLSGSG